jgi:hypothetical protein
MHGETTSPWNDNHPARQLLLFELVEEFSTTAKMSPDEVFASTEETMEFKIEGMLDCQVLFASQISQGKLFLKQGTDQRMSFQSASNSFGKSSLCLL